MISMKNYEMTVYVLDRSSVKFENYVECGSAARKCYAEWDWTQDRKGLNIKISQDRGSGVNG